MTVRVSLPFVPSLSTSLFAVAAAVFVLVPASSVAQRVGSDSINAHVGDVSWTARFGRPPTADDSEDMRIRTHLEWVVEQLSEADVSHLDGVATAQRQRLLSELAEYSRVGGFPRHMEGSMRRPRFVDERGNHCAVGHLMRFSGRGDLVEAIRHQHEYDLIRDIRVAGIAEWAATNGLSLDELGMIQPSYGSPRQPDDGSHPGYGNPRQPNGLGQVVARDNSGSRPRVEVRAGEGVEESTIQRMIRRHSARLVRCHEGQRRQFPAWAGQVEFEVVAQPGELPEVRPLRAVQGVILRCARQALMRMRFPSDTLQVFRVVLDYSGDRSGARPVLTRASLVRFLDSLRPRVDSCVRRRHRDTQVRLRVRARPSGEVTIRVRVSPRSRVMDQCINRVLENASARIHSEFEVSSVVRARRAWTVVASEESVARGSAGVVVGANSNPRK